MPESPPPVRATTIKKFLKDRAQVRISEEAIDLMVQGLEGIAEGVAEKASDAAIGEGRSTMMDRDVQHAFDLHLQLMGSPLVSPEGLRVAIRSVSNEDLTDLIRLIKADIKEGGGNP